MAVLRSSLPSSRSSWRTPASRVYSATIVCDDVVGDLDLVLAEAVALALPRPEVALGDRDLLVDRVAVEADHLHAVEERPGDRLGNVGGRDEDDLRQVELDVEVVVAERVVLRRVEHLEQRRGRVAAPVGADLVDLVEHDHRVHRPGVAQGADEPARQRADVGAPVAADLGLVADAAERHPHELSVERTGDRLADRGLARPGRADQGEDRAGALVLLDSPLLAQLAHGQVLDDPLLHVLQAGVVGVEDLAGDLRVEPLVRRLTPGHGQEPVEVGADHRRLARGIAHALEPVELALRLLAHLVGHARFPDLRPVLVDHRALVLAELLADRLELLAQEVLPLLGLRAGLDVLADAPADLQLGQPLALQRHGEPQPLDHVERLEQLDALREREVGRIGAGVGERAGLGDRAQELADAGVRLAELQDLLDDGAIFGLELARLDRGRRLVGLLLDLDIEAAAGARLRSVELCTRFPAQRRDLPATRETAGLDDLGHRPDLRIRPLMPGDEQNARLARRIERHRHRHAWKDNGFVQRNQQIFLHRVVHAPGSMMFS